MHWECDLVVVYKKTLGWHGCLFSIYIGGLLIAIIKDFEFKLRQYRSGVPEIYIVTSKYKLKDHTLLKKFKMKNTDI